MHTVISRTSAAIMCRCVCVECVTSCVYVATFFVHINTCGTSIAFYKISVCSVCISVEH